MPCPGFGSCRSTCLHHQQVASYLEARDAWEARWSARWPEGWSEAKQHKEAEPCPRFRDWMGQPQFTHRREET